jgi:hypothetical protein
MSDCHHCDLCYTWRATPGRCLQIACTACGAVQCHSNGLARGCCKVCHFGRLPGWSFSYRSTTCQYKGCNKPAVYAFLPGTRQDCCLEHGRAILERRAAKRRVA